ncbi:MAG TPA: glycosyl hydrolase, partial [Saprospiraceae bacterium]|nr:glycosyl hydrolase [Saprospiraceae bacterium]
MSYRKTLTLALVLFVGLAIAQKKQTPAAVPDPAKDPLQSSLFSNLKFRSLGPALASGRIADLAINPLDHREYYVAVASGGVWKTLNAGVTFQPVFDGEGSYSIGCLALDPLNPNVVWVGTGENNNQRSVAYGDGIYKSEDGGKSWKNMGLKTSEHIGRIAIDPQHPETVYVAAYGPVWSSGGERGIYKTTDGGLTWKRVLQVSEHTGFNEVMVDPRYPNIVYAAAHQRQRKVFTYIGGGPESALYKS